MLKQVVGSYDDLHDFMANAGKSDAGFSTVSALDTMSSLVFDDATMKAHVGDEVFARFKANVDSGEATPAADQKVIADALLQWGKENGAVSFAHWFFPMRGGGGAVGGALGALKQDALIDLDWSSNAPIKPFDTHFPHERLFVGETDGSSFPNGDLRVTHRAAAFTTWDRSSPITIYNKVMRIPCAFVTHLGDSIDEKTPLLRSCDAVNKEGCRLLSNMNFQGVSNVHSYLGWEQEFFVISKEAYLARPDLVNCGRTLIGAEPARAQQADLNYFAPIPAKVERLLHRLQNLMLQMGCPMSVAHNEVAPGQHEMSPIYCVASASADYNVLFMELAEREATALGLAVLFHEKPFAGINGSGKHANWSVGTDTGINFFHPGKTDRDRELFVTAVACLTWGLCQHNEILRCAVVGAGNDHRLGAQEAPPAIMSLYPGVGFEQHANNIVAGGDLLSYQATKGQAHVKARAAMPAETNAEDRNRTAPFPWCGNRFEFRAVGSAQNCSFPVATCNTILASGMAHCSELLESGTSLRDAVAQMLAQTKHVIFTGNGYSPEWPVEAEARGLPNLSNTPKAIATFNSAKAKAVFEAMGVLSAEECDARQKVYYENFNTSMSIETCTFISMIETGILPACAKDLALYAAAPSLAGNRAKVYAAIKVETDRLGELLAAVPSGGAAEATYYSEVVKPQMVVARALVDKAEGLIERSLYPYPTYETMVYSHH
jgi:glutamine synthetase